MAAPAILGVKAWANYTSAGSGASTTVTNTGTTVASRALLALISGQATNNTPAFSDSKGNTWTKIASLQNGTDAVAMYLCGDPANVGTNHSFTVNWTDGYSSVAVLELDQAVALDNSSTATPAATPWGSSLTTLSADCLVVAATAVYATSGSWALAATGWTWYGQLPVAGDATDWDIGLLHKTSATATANAISMTGTDVDGATPHHLIMASLKAVGAAGASVSPAGIGSSAAYGAPVLGAGLAPAGVATAATLGAPSAAAQLAPGGIGQAAAYGAPAASPSLLPGGIAAASAYGSPTVTPAGAGIQPSGIGSGAALGAPALAASLAPSSIAEASTIGAPGAAALLAAAGIATGETWGTPALTLTTGLLPGGIGSAAAYGVPVLGVGLAPGGLGSFAAIGTPAVMGTHALGPAGLASAAAFGLPLVYDPDDAGPSEWVHWTMPAESQHWAMPGEGQDYRIPGETLIWKMTP
jgi:hypothetical protein